MPRYIRVRAREGTKFTHAQFIGAIWGGTEKAQIQRLNTKDIILRAKEQLGISRSTVLRYLKYLVEAGDLHKTRVGRRTLYTPKPYVIMGNEVKGSFSPGEFYVFRAGKPKRIIGFLYMAKKQEQEELAKLVDEQGVKLFQRNVLTILRSLSKGEAFANREMLFIPFPVDMRGIGFAIETNWGDFLRSAIMKKIKQVEVSIPQVTFRLDCLRRGEPRENNTPWCLALDKNCLYENWYECPIIHQDAEKILQNLSAIDSPQQVPIQKYVSKDFIDKTGETKQDY